MRHLADQPAHRVAGKPGIGVERDDVAYVVGNSDRRSVRAQESRVRSRREAACSVHEASRACVPSRSSVSRFRSRPGVDAARESDRLQVLRRIACSVRRCLPTQLQAAPHPRSRSHCRHRPNPTEARNEDRPPDWRDDESRAARSALRPTPAIVSIVGTATSVLKCAGTPAASSMAGKGAAPNACVTNRFTNATDRSIAGIAPTTPSKPSHHRSTPMASKEPAAVRPERRRPPGDPHPHSRECPWPCPCARIQAFGDDRKPIDLSNAWRPSAIR